METCSICLDALDGGVAALACGHRFHAACLASMAGAVGTASSTSRRGTLTACPNCRTTSRVETVTRGFVYQIHARLWPDFYEVGTTPLRSRP